MAGAFGFAKENYGISRDIANLKMVPEIGKTPRGSFVIADVFSCRHQIEHCTNRKVLHLAQVLDLDAAWLVRQRHEPVGDALGRGHIFGLGHVGQLVPAAEVGGGAERLGGTR